jgi:hypothetical protein
MNTDEPLVEASIVGNTLPEGMSYKGNPDKYSSSKPEQAVRQPE